MPRTASFRSGRLAGLLGLGIDHERTLAVDDNVNDVERLSLTGIGIAMGTVLEPSRTSRTR